MEIAKLRNNQLAAGSITVHLVEGVTGGFVPAVPRKKITVKWNSPNFTITKWLLAGEKDINAVDGYVEYSCNKRLAAEMVESFCKTTLEKIKLINSKL